MMIDHYLTIESPKESLLKEKSSKFHGYAFPVTSVEEIEECITNLKKSHLKARHYCYAYKLGMDNNNFRANDDGEPSGTAGRPIFGQIEKLELTNTLVVVVRYFGGTKLGTSGLIKAYKESAAMTLEECTIIEKIIFDTITIKCAFDLVGNIMNILSSANIKIIDSTYDNLATIIIEVRLTEIDSTITYVKSKLLNRPENDIDAQTVVDGVGFNHTSL